MSLRLDRKAYLTTPVVENFIRYLRDLINGSDFPHSVHIHDSKLPDGYLFKFGRDLSIRNLEEAYDRYFWDKRNFANTQIALASLQVRIRAAIADGMDSEALLSAIESLLEWGAGGRRSSLFTSNLKWALANQSVLCELIRVGCDTFASETPDVFVFLNGPRLNAGYTKLYSLACENVVIYDGRVGAAMGLLVRRFCELKDISPVPAHLAFRWGRARTQRWRDPSTSKHRFRALSTSGATWAQSNIFANWILTSALSESKSGWCSTPDGLRRLEAALFMIGYDLPRAPIPVR